MTGPRFKAIAGILIFLAGAGVDLGLQNLMRPYAREGIYFQAWSSEDMMQTVSIRDLRSAPLTTLLNLHIEPPGFDFIRAVLAQFWPSLDLPDLLIRVDSSLYILWAVLLGLLGVLIFLWLSQQCSPPIAVVGALLFMFHPASIFYATYLDTTLLTALLVAGTYYMLWKMKNGYAVSMLGFGAVTLALFFTRSIFQLPFIILSAACAYLLGAPRRRLLTFVLVTGLVGGIYTAKQWFQFGTLSTSSLAGVNLANSVGVGMGTNNYAAYLTDPANRKIADGQLPDVLVSTTKLGGQPNFNNINYLGLNAALIRRFQKHLSSSPLPELLASYGENLAIYFEPSSSYSSNNVIVDRLPWRAVYDRAFSAPVLPIMLLIALSIWSARVIKRRLYLQAGALLVPGLYIFLASVLLDKGENMRFKYFLEPVMFVFLLSQIFFAGRSALAALQQRLHPLPRPVDPNNNSRQFAEPLPSVPDGAAQRHGHSAPGSARLSPLLAHLWNSGNQPNA